MPELLLRFTGLCAFVPNHPVQAKQMTVLMPATTGEHALSGRGSHGGPAEPHVPVLVAYERSFATPPDLRFQSKGLEPMGLIYLDTWNLEIQGACLKSLDVVGQNEWPPRSEEAFSWVASMPRINVHGSTSLPRGEVLDRCLGRRVPRSVAARVRLTQGELTNYALALDSEGGVVTWAFRQNDDDTPSVEVRPISEEVQLRFPIRGREVSFKLTGDIHAPKRPQRRRRLTLRRTGRYLEVEAWICNMPLGQILRRDYGGDRALSLLSPSQSASDSGEREPDRDFLSYYVLLKSGKSRRFPHPFGRLDATAGGPSNEAPKCPPVVMSPNPNA